MSLAQRELKKMNEHHDNQGRFASTDGSAAPPPQKEVKQKKMKEKVYTYTGPKDISHLKGHQLLVAVALQKVGTGSLSQIVEEVKKGAPYNSIHDLEVSVRGNLAAGASKFGWAKIEKDVDPSTLATKDNTPKAAATAAPSSSETTASSLPSEKSVTNAEFDALMNYKGSGYVMINGFLRDNPNLAVKSGGTANRVKNIDRLMAASVTTKDTVVYRGVKANSIEKRIKDQEGKLTLTDHGFVSTAASPDGLMTAMGGLHVPGWAVMEIHVPAGTPVLDVEGLKYRFNSNKTMPHQYYKEAKVGPYDPTKIHVSKFTEQELLLPHGSTFHISGSEKRVYGGVSRKVYKVTLVKHSPLWKLFFAQLLNAMPKENNRFLWEDGDVVIHPPDDEGDVEKIDVDWTDEEDDLTDMLMEEYGVGYAEAMASLGRYEEFGGIDEAAAKWAGEHAADLVSEIEETTVDKLRTMIADAIEAGLTPAQLADRIGESGLFDEARAKLIAFNEVAMAQGEGALESWRESGVVSGKRSILGSAHDKDDECDENEAAGVIPIDEEFPSGHMASPFHPNCVCDIVGSVTQD